MLRRLVLALCALFCLGSALMGVEFSGATWTDTSETTAEVSAAYDWTPPTVTVTDPGSVQTGTVTIRATAWDSRSSIGSVTIQYSPAGSPASWTTLTGCATTGSGMTTVSCPWATTSVPDGSYQLQAIATDTAGNTATSSPVTTAVANNVGVHLTLPGSYLRNSVPVRGDLVNPVVPTTLTLEYKGSSGGWTQLNGSCSSPTSPVTCTWDTTKVPDGTYDVRVTAGTGQSDTQTGVVVDNTAPTANVTVPSGPLAGTVSLGGSGTDGTSGVASVRIQYGKNGSWTDCGTGTSSPYSCNLDTTMLSDGNYDFQVVVTDRAGNTTTSAPVITRTVVNSVPTVTITAPTAGANLDGTVTISGSGQSTNGTQTLKLEYQPAAGGAWTTACTPTVSGTSYTYSCSWNTSGVTNGGYNLRATLTPTYGNAATSTVAVNVQHPTGSVSITSPGTGTTVKGAVTISGPVASSGTISKVVVTATPTGTTGGPPITACSVNAPFNSGTFTCSWNTAGVLYGTYSLVAVMTDSNGTRTSAAVNVTVDNIVATLVLGPLPANLKGPSTTLTATATTNSTIGGVRFEGTTASGTTTLCTATLSGGVWSCPWNLAPITYGAYSVQAVMTQSPGSEVRSDVKSTVVDQRVLAGSSVSIGTGGSPGVLDAGDKVVMVYTGLVKLSTVQASLTKNGSVPVAVSLTRSGKSVDWSLGSGVNVGSLGLTSSPPYLNGGDKELTFTGSTLAASEQPDANGYPVTVLTITLGTPSRTASSKDLTPKLTWTTSSSVTDEFGVASQAGSFDSTGGNF